MQMCDALRRRLSGWARSDLATYRQAYQQYGGGVNTHPDVVSFIMQSSGLEVDFWACWRAGILTGAYFTTARGQGGMNVWRQWPVTYDELLFPLSPQHRFWLPVHSNRLAWEHQSQVWNATYRLFRKVRNCRVKSHFGAKHEKTRRNEVSRFMRRGGASRPVADLSTDELARVFVTLFAKRFGEAVNGYEEGRLRSMLTALRPLLFGHVLYLHGEPCAYDLIFMTESPAWLYFDAPNGGVDPAHASLSVGSVLMWLNICAARSLCQQRGKAMKFSLGHYSEDWDYKLRWAEPLRLGKTLF